MAALIRVRFTNGKESTVSADYPRVWPEDIDSILESDHLDTGTVLTPEPAPVKESQLVAPAKEKK